ncbi:hypothetical protein BE11_47010 [Sorangium cellulosum]|nr:hypothetical protein BE11_47010 [Sorangium cellulosum]
MTLPGTRGKDGKSTFHPYFVEENIVKALPDYLERYSQFGVATPIAILVSVLGVKGSKLPESWRHFAHRHEIDRDTLLLPDVLLREYPEDADESLPQILRPAFDALWQACGVPHSFHYDEEGCWKESFEW